MKILFVLENYYPKVGGVETLFKDLCEKLVEQGKEVQVLTTATKGQKRKDCIHGVQIHRINILSRYLFTLFAFFPALRYARWAEIIHCTSYNAALPAWLAAGVTNKPVVITFHEVWGKLWFRLPFMSQASKIGHYLFEKLLTKLPFDRVVAVSQNTATELQKAGVSKGNIEVIYNGIDYHAFMPKYDEGKDGATFVYTYFGRLGVSKGLDLLMEAVPAFQAEYPNSCLQLIIPREPSSMVRRIKKWLHRESLQDHVRIYHSLEFDELKKRITDSSCVIIPSYSEGFCFAAVETIALGVPVVVSGKGALKEVVSGKYIIMPSFDVEGLIKGLQYAYNGKWEESQPKRFELNETIEGYLNLYRDL